MIPPHPGPAYRFNPPPGWPLPPPEWIPPTVPWDARPSLPPAPENWQWWIGPEPSATGDAGKKTASVWWQRQTHSVRRLIGSGAVFILISQVLPRSSWFMYWHNNLTGGTFTVSELHAYCSSPLVQAATTPGSTQANDCVAASDWSTLCVLLLLVGIALLIIAAYKIYQQHGTSNAPARPLR